MSLLSPSAILGGIFNNAAYSDLALVVGSTRFHVHRFVLTQGSGLIETLLRAPRANPAEINIALPDLDHIPVPEDVFCPPEEYFKSFLRVLYQLHRIEDLPVATVVAVAVVADFALAEGIKVLCDHYLSDQPFQPRYSPFAKLHQMPKLEQETLKMFAKNAATCNPLTDLPLLEPDDVSNMMPFLNSSAIFRFNFFIKLATKFGQNIDDPDAVLLIPDIERMKLFSDWCEKGCGTWPSFQTVEYIVSLSERIRVADDADLETLKIFGKFRDWVTKRLFHFFSTTKNVICSLVQVWLSPYSHVETSGNENS